MQRASDQTRKSLKNVHESQILSPKSLNNRILEASTKDAHPSHLGSPFSLPPLAVSPVKKTKPTGQSCSQKQQMRRGKGLNDLVPGAGSGNLLNGNPMALSGKAARVTKKVERMSSNHTHQITKSKANLEVFQDRAAM